MSVSTARQRTPALEPGFFAEKGVLPWLFSLDHKRIALMQLGAMGGAFVVGALAALLMYAEHIRGEAYLIDATTYARAFTLHGTVMMFLVLLPGIPATLGTFVLPLQLGARNVAFPRLNLTSFHLWLLGALLVVISIHQGGADTGWTFLAPLSTEAGGGAGYLLLALLVLAVSSVLRAVVVIATLHTLRVQGMTWRRTTPFAWSLYAHSIVVAIAAPVLVLTVVLLLAERSLGVGLFDPLLGGDPLLFQHFFWFAAHACAYSAMLPAVGVATEVIGTFSNRGLAARRSVVIGIIGLTGVSLLAWGEHVPTSGHSVLVTTLFGFIALLGLVPATHLVGSWLTSLSRGATPAAPLLFALGFVATFVVGGLSGLFLGTLNTGVHLHGTLFVVGHSHLMLGGVVLALLAGLHFWWSKLTGTAYAEPRARVGALVLLGGMLVAFVPWLILGARGLPRRMATYPAEYEVLQNAASVGGVLLLVGLGLVCVNLLTALRDRRPAEANPWKARGLEWSCPSPPPSDNFVVPPTIEG